MFWNYLFRNSAEVQATVMEAFVVFLGISSLQPLPFTTCLLAARKQLQV
jgi:hypothetical protein